MALTAGSKLGPYEILAPLGARGMGEVYRAKDTRLGRTVAIKVLPAHLSRSSFGVAMNDLLEENRLLLPRGPARGDSPEARAPRAAMSTARQPSSRAPPTRRRHLEA